MSRQVSLIRLRLYGNYADTFQLLRTLFQLLDGTKAFNRRAFHSVVQMIVSVGRPGRLRRLIPRPSLRHLVLFGFLTHVVFELAPKRLCAQVFFELFLEVDRLRNAFHVQLVLEDLLLEYLLAKLVRVHAVDEILPRDVVKRGVGARANNCGLAQL